MPDSEIIRQAAAEGGWVASLLVALVLSGFMVLGWFVRQIWLDQRETRIFQRDTLVSLIGTTNTIMQEVREEMHNFRESIIDFRQAISSAPCGELLRQQQKPRRGKDE
jgi:hypothetical protein